MDREPDDGYFDERAAAKYDESAANSAVQPTIRIYAQRAQLRRRASAATAGRSFRPVPSGL